MKTKKLYEQPQAEVMLVDTAYLLVLSDGEQEEEGVVPGTTVPGGSGLSKERGGDDFDWDLGF